MENLTVFRKLEGPELMYDSKQLRKEHLSFLLKRFNNKSN